MVKLYIAAKCLHVALNFMKQWMIEWQFDLISKDRIALPNGQNLSSYLNLYRFPFSSGYSFTLDLQPMYVCVCLF